MKYFINARIDNTRYRLAEGFLLFFGAPLVRRKITHQERISTGLLKQHKDPAEFTQVSNRN